MGHSLNPLFSDSINPHMAPLHQIIKTSIYILVSISRERSITNFLSYTLVVLVKVSLCSALVPHSLALLGSSDIICINSEKKH
jgi:hypothetical protein